MKNRIIALSCMLVLSLNMVGSAAADGSAKKKGQADQLAQLLPPVDGIATLNVKRFFSTALPKVLSSNQPLLDKFNGKVEAVKMRTGIDLRQFDSLAVGITAKQVAAKDYDLDHLVIARGQVSSASVIGAAKLAANGKYREEKVGDRIVYILSAKDIADRVKQNAPADGDVFDKMLGEFSGEIALTAIDTATIAFGDPDLVRQAAGPRIAVQSDLLPLLAKKEGSVVSFAGRLPNGMSVFLPLDNDELGKDIDAIRYVYGGMDVVGEAATVSVTARTLQNQQASSLRETLEGLQLLGKALLGNAKGADKKVYARMVENAKFTSSGNEVTLDLQVPQSDIDILVAGLK